MQTNPIVVLIAVIAISLVGLLVRTYLVSLVKERVRAQIDERLEKLRSELRKTEDAVRSDLKRYEEEVGSLRTGVLEGRAQRQAKVSSRRIDSLEELWGKFQRLGRFKFMATTYSMLKLDQVEKEIGVNDGLQEFIRTIMGDGFDQIIDKTNAGTERIYVPEIVWATYSAYSSIMFSIYAHMKALSLGIEDGSKLMDFEAVGKLAKAVLPHQSKFIDQYGSTGLPYLLEEIEKKMLEEVRSALLGTEDDQQALAQSKIIMERVNAVSKESQGISSEAPTSRS